MRRDAEKGDRTRRFGHMKYRIQIDIVDTTIASMILSDIEETLADYGITPDDILIMPIDEEEDR